MSASRATSVMVWPGLISRPRASRTVRHLVHTNPGCITGLSPCPVTPFQHDKRHDLERLHGDAEGWHVLGALRGERTSPVESEGGERDSGRTHSRTPSDPSTCLRIIVLLGLTIMSVRELPRRVSDDRHIHDHRLLTGFVRYDVRTTDAVVCLDGWFRFHREARRRQLLSQQLRHPIVPFIPRMSRPGTLLNHMCKGFLTSWTHLTLQINSPRRPGPPWNTGTQPGCALHPRKTSRTQFGFHWRPIG